ncbi:TPM domain-containing protein [Flavobacterium cheniae]|uniref:TLP18.3/Psb32/MOLO-1 phosphatase superfamily protein n=1 Tax=Flavobacterium cheniae TaxID=295428 RepID=A0A562KAW0_9FLAO|nr:TPM domain-containing protein [Flavobacterium cheniae]TDR24005.1 TLP18.3/Psb32/MOLO-1 phosphatase superfamily protein [Flavobacterium cheniae]TWH92569.1 TLP18.3/Psb32/MOLO-1 phosphatase superfamily protein [Flavobacterium cheniae]
MSKTEDFLSKAEEQEIVHAIVEAEKNTSGEIRVHIEEHTEKSPLERAQEVFFELKMDETQDRNGVLFYICVSDKKFAIIGDKGINEAVESDFWDCTKDTVIANFKEDNFKKGLVEGILRAGERLKKYFPFQSDDTNELSNEISRS